MKKYLALILGVMFVLGFAASAFAIHAEIPAETQAAVAKGSTQITIGGEIRFRGAIQNNTSDFDSDKADYRAYYDTRVRLSVDAIVTPNVEGFIQVEAGNGIEGKGSDLYVWGNGNCAANDCKNSNASGVYSVGDSKRGALNILQAWILHKGSGLLGFPAGLKVGHMPLALGNSLFFDHTKYGDDAIVFFMDPMKELHIGLLTIKFREGNLTWNDDANAYVALANYRTKEFGIGGDVTYVDDQDSNGNGLLGAVGPIHFWNFGLRGDVNVAGFFLKGDVEFQAGEVKPANANNLKFKGWAALASAGYKVDPVTLALEFAAGSGDDKADNDIKAFVTSQSAIQHFTYVYEYLTPNACGMQYGGLCNTWYVKLGAEANLMKDMGGLLNLYYLQAMKRELGVAGINGVDRQSKSIGFEVDAKVTYKIDRNFTYWVEGGYLFAGNFWKPASSSKSVDDAYGLRHGLQLSF